MVGFVAHLSPYLARLPSSVPAEKPKIKLCLLPDPQSVLRPFQAILLSQIFLVSCVLWSPVVTSVYSGVTPLQFAHSYST